MDVGSSETWGTMTASLERVQLILVDVHSAIMADRYLGGTLPDSCRGVEHGAVGGVGCGLPTNKVFHMSVVYRKVLKQQRLPRVAAGRRPLLCISIRKTIGD